jgi:ribonuclease Y
MSNEGGSDQGEPTWEPVDDPGAQDRAEKVEEKERRLDQREQELEDRERELNKRERELEQRNQDILERREEVVDARDQLDEREDALDGREQTLDEREGRLKERSKNLDDRERELDDRENEIKSQREALEEYAVTDVQTFTARPRKVGGLLLGVAGVLSVVAGGLLLVGGGVGGVEALTSQTLVENPNLTLAFAAAYVVVTLVELLGGLWAYRGSHWFFSVFAGIVSMIFLLPLFPLGLTATLLISIGESQFK